MIISRVYFMNTEVILGQVSAGKPHFLPIIRPHAFPINMHMCANILYIPQNF